MWRSVPVSLQLLCFQEHVANRDNIRVREQEEQKAEEERRQLFLSAKDKMMKLRKDREVELLRCNLARQPRPLNSVVHQLNNFTHKPFFFFSIQRSPEAQRKHHEGPDSRTARAVGQPGAEDRQGCSRAGRKAGPAVVVGGGEEGGDAEVHPGPQRTDGNRCNCTTLNPEDTTSDAHVFQIR